MVSIEIHVGETRAVNPSNDLTKVVPTSDVRHIDCGIEVVDGSEKCG